ncbi:MAG: peroxiredoxin [Polyangiaceae bacterium]
MKRTAWLAGIGAAVLAAGGLALAKRPAQRPDGGSGPLPVGAAAPDVSGQDQQGRAQSLRGELGHPVLVYFYPRDGTPGCTAEACAFRDAWERYAKAGVTLFGVSSDDARSHAHFAEEHRIPFPLIADGELRWADAFGVSRMLGITSRISFLIDPAGKVAKVYRDVDPGVHADEVLRDVAALPQPGS